MFVFASGVLIGTPQGGPPINFGVFDSRDPLTPGASALNAPLDVIDAALAPQGGDLLNGRQTLGGAACDCKIAGVPVRDTGDIDGDRLAAVRVRMMLP